MNPGVLESYSGRTTFTRLYNNGGDTEFEDQQELELATTKTVVLPYSDCNWSIIIIISSSSSSSSIALCL